MIDGGLPAHLSLNIHLVAFQELNHLEVNTFIDIYGRSPIIKQINPVPQY
jgi:hypothetical protein